MLRRHVTVVLTVFFLCLMVPTASVSQGSRNWSIQRIANGQPDLQGVWDFRTLTPLQRPEDQEKAVLTPEEAAELESRAAARAEAAVAPSEV